MIRTQGLTKSFGAHWALRGIDINVEQGELVAVLGPNGAGKTTLIRILSTLIKSSSGSAYVADSDVRKRPHDVRRRLGVISHKTFLYETLTARENLRFFGKMYTISDLDSRIDELLERVGLKWRADDLVRNYSRGMQQRLALARSILHRPSVLLLDEPYSGLDQNASEILSQQIELLLNENRTVLMTTHDFDRALERKCRICILDRGKIITEAVSTDLTRNDLKQTFRQLGDRGKASGD
jgi:heme exporter protein A